MYISNTRDIKRELKDMDHTTVIEIWIEEFGAGYDTHVSLTFNGRTTYYQIGEEESFKTGRRKALALQENLQKADYPNVTFKYLQAVYNLDYLNTLSRDRLLDLMEQHGFEKGYEELDDSALLDQLATYS